MGPHVADIFNPRAWVHPSFNVDNITLEVTRITLITGLFIIGVQLPGSFMHKHAKSLLVMIVPTMAIGWIIVAAFIKILFPILGFVACLAIASYLTPTDPIISAAIVGGRYAEENVRAPLTHLIAAESAANDGLAYPFLTFAIYLTVDKTVKEGIRDWILIGILCMCTRSLTNAKDLLMNQDQVILGTVIGALLGWLFSKLMKYLYKLKWINNESYVMQCLALAVFVGGVVSTIGRE
jgi:NhaP-type Na+/H+ or K+/H+ antiporter